MPGRSTAMLSWLLAAIVLLSCILVVQYQQLLTLKEVVQAMPDPVPADSLKTSWKSGGQVIQVVTAREVGESDAALLVRHTNAVRAKLADFPIDNS